MVEASPTTTEIVTGFALVCGLFILRAIHKLYDQGIRHEKLPKLVEIIGEKLDGVISRFDRHCSDEEAWQRMATSAAERLAVEVRETAERVAKEARETAERVAVESRETANRAASVTQATISEMDMRLTDRIEAIAAAVRERREGHA